MTSLSEDRPHGGGGRGRTGTVPLAVGLGPGPGRDSDRHGSATSNPSGSEHSAGPDSLRLILPGPLRLIPGPGPAPGPRRETLAPWHASRINNHGVWPSSVLRIRVTDTVSRLGRPRRRV
jgi:hypothetical protein